MFEKQTNKKTNKTKQTNQKKTGDKAMYQNRHLWINLVYQHYITCDSQVLNRISPFKNSQTKLLNSGKFKVTSKIMKAVFFLTNFEEYKHAILSMYFIWFNIN